MYKYLVGCDNDDLGILHLFYTKNINVIDELNEIIYSYTQLQNEARSKLNSKIPENFTSISYDSDLAEYIDICDEKWERIREILEKYFDDIKIDVNIDLEIADDQDIFVLLFPEQLVVIDLELSMKTGETMYRYSPIKWGSENK